MKAFNINSMNDFHKMMGEPLPEEIQMKVAKVKALRTTSHSAALKAKQAKRQAQRDAKKVACLASYMNNR